MTIPCGWDDVSIVMDRRNPNSLDQKRAYLTPDRYHELVLVTHRMNDLFKYIKREMSANILEESEQDGNATAPSIHTAYKSTFAYMKRWPTKVKRISNFQKQMVREWTATYDAVDRLIWPAIVPREEMSTDEAILAMIKIFEELGMIEPTKHGSYTYVKGSENRLVFQYGDVLTIKKWYSLGYYLLRQITTIGKEDYVNLMMTVYSQFAKMQDSLHENIHRLQGIYKLYYGGFLQPIQVISGTMLMVIPRSNVAMPSITSDFPSPHFRIR